MCAISIICLAVVLVVVLKDSLITYFKSLSWSLGVRSLSLGVRSRGSWSLGVRSLSWSWPLGVRSLLTSLYILCILEVIPAQSANHYRLIDSLSLPIRLCVRLSPSSPLPSHSLPCYPLLTPYPLLPPFSL